MSIVSRKEFASLCGDADMGNLNVNIGRGKVIVHGDGGKLIDTSHPMNKLYQKQRLSINEQKKETEALIKTIPVNPRKNLKFDEDEEDDPLPAPLDESLIRRTTRRNRSDGDDDGEGMNKWIKMKVKGDAELVTVRVEKEKLQLDKAAGKLLPIDVVLNTHRIYARSIFSSFETGIEQIASKFCGIMAGGDIGMYTRVLEECKQVLKECVTKAGKQTDEDIDQIITEFSESRARGERKI